MTPIINPLIKPQDNEVKIETKTAIIIHIIILKESVCLAAKLINIKAPTIPERLAVFTVDRLIPPETIDRNIASDNIPNSGI